MAKFIEYKPQRALKGLLTIGSSLVIPLLAAVLFIRESISVVGFCAIVSVAVIASALIGKWFEDRSRTVVEIASGKSWKKPFGAGTATRSLQTFGEQASRLELLGPLTFLLIFIVLWLLRSGPGMSRVMVPVCLLVAAVPVCFVTAASDSRIEIGADRVRVTHPFLGRWRARSFGFGEIDTVEVKEMDGGGRLIQIVLKDQSSVIYRNRDENVVHAVVEALKRGVAESKPAPLDWSELA